VRVGCDFAMCRRLDDFCAGIPNLLRRISCQFKARLFCAAVNAERREAYEIAQRTFCACC
jgi:hypothetical protein